jgi:hypothetical protein
VSNTTRINFAGFARGSSPLQLRRPPLLR